MKREIRIVIVDDHPIARQGLLKILEREAGIKVVAEARDARQAMAEIKATAPDIVVLDIQMDDSGDGTTDGFEITRQIRQANLPAEIIFLTFHTEPYIFNKFLQSGAKGYLLKSDPPSEIIRGIKEVAAGREYMSGDVKDKFLEAYRRATAQRHSKTQSEVVFTPAEEAVLEIISQHKTSKEAGQVLGKSPRTIDEHIRNMLKKLGRSRRSALIDFWRNRHHH